MTECDYHKDILKRIDNEKKSIENQFSQIQREKERYLAELEYNSQNRKVSLHQKKKRIRKDIEVRQQGEVGAINSIIISGDGKSSMVSIGGKCAREGDFINGFKILKIFPDRVEFEKNGEILVQKMK